MPDGSAPEWKTESLCERIVKRLGYLKNERSQMESYWSDLSQYFEPAASRYILSGGNQGQRHQGSRQNSKVVRNTPFMARRTFIAGMMSGLTSPARPWFRLTTPDPGLAEFGPVKSWLFAVEQRMREVFAKSNLYQALPAMYGSIGTYGTSCMLALEDNEDVVRFYPQALGTYWLSQSNRLTVDTMYRKFQMTVRQMLQEFGFEACSERVQSMAKNGQWDQWIDIVHAIEPNDERLLGMIGSSGMKYRSIYIEQGSDNKEKPLARRGFNESAVIAPRWEVGAEDTYGSECPGMVALGPTRALMIQERRKAQAIDKMVTPPLRAPTSLRNALLDNVAGGVTYIDVAQGSEGVKSLYDVRFDVNALIADIQETNQEIEQAWYADLFLAITSMEGVQPRNQFELVERKEEKLLQLGPALERMNDEGLDPIIDRTFAIGVRLSMPYWKGIIDGEPLFPPPPPELQSTDLKVEYISILAQAQKAIGVSSLDRLIAFTGALATQKQDPSVWDKIDTDQSVDEYASMLGTSPLVVRSDEDVEAMRAQRQQANQMAQLQQGAETVATIAGAAKTLGETPMDDNALTRLAGAAA